jgi:hypothetical protein
MTPSDLEAIEQRANAATPGPWDPLFQRNDNGSWGEVLSEKKLVAEVCTDIGCLMSDADQNNTVFLAAARSDVPALVAEVRRLRAALEEAFDELLENPLDQDLFAPAVINARWLIEERCRIALGRPP